MTAPHQPVDPRIPRALSRAEAYPDEADAQAGVEHVQTHLSHVFLTRSRVYKLRKAVRFDFVDFGSRDARDADCMRELELNRRLASDVYLGVAPVWITRGHVQVGELGERLVPTTSEGSSTAEHCVVMQRLAAGRDALSLLEAGELGTDALTALADRIARFHAAHPLAASLSVEAWRRRIEDPVRENFRMLERAQLDAESAARIERIEARARELMAQRGARFDDRFKQGRAIDGHGDLHLQHVWLLPERSEPIVIDCVEFAQAFRELDPASEVAFLAMDLGYRGRLELAEHFLRAYAEASDDYTLFGVVDYFVSYRSAVRAKVAALASGDPQLDGKQRARANESVSRHLEFAERALTPRPAGRLLAVTGMIGTGKTTVARALGEALEAAVLSSDRVRKRLAGLQPLARTDERWGTGIFGTDMSDATYAGLLERAQPLLESGRSVVLDATYGSVERRTALYAWAQARELDVWLVEVRCDPARAQARLAERRARSDDASDAGPEHQAASAQSYDPPREWPKALRLVVDTDAPDWRAGLQAKLTVRS